MRYMLLIYLDEKGLDEAEREACYRESTALAHELSLSGHYLASAPLHPTALAASAIQSPCPRQLSRLPARQIAGPNSRSARNAAPPSQAMLSAAAT